MLHSGECNLYLYHSYYNNTMFRVLYSFQEPTLPVYLQKTWQLNSSQVGLVFFSAALPAMLGQSPYNYI